MATIDYNKLKGSNTSQAALKGLAAMGSGSTITDTPTPPLKSVVKDNVPQTDNVPQADTAPKVFDKAKIGENITKTFETPGIGDQLANSQFRDAAFRYAYGRDASKTDIENTKGQSVSGILKMLGIDDLIPNFGYEKGLDSTKDSAKPDVATAQTDKTQVEDRKLTIDDRIAQYEDSLRGIKDEASESAKLSEKTSTERLLKSELEQMVNAMDLNKILDIETSNIRGESFEEGTEALAEQKLGRAVTMKGMAAQLNKRVEDFNKETSQINREKMLKEATDIYKYNTKLSQYKLAKGEADEARQDVKYAADSFKEYRAMAIEDMERESIIDRQEAADLQMKNSNMWQKEQAGYVSIDPNNYEAMVREYGENKIYTDAYGDSYLKPAAETVGGDFQFITGSENQQGGVFDKNTGTFTTFGNYSSTDDTGNVITSTGDVYDIGSYATDPNHEASIQGMLQKMGQFKTVEDIDSYIQSVAPTSKITGQMIANSSAKHGVSWEMMTAIMQQDSSLGTQGLGARNNNPGNIGQFDSLGTKGVKGYKTLQDGVDAVAKNLAWRKVQTQQLDQEVSAYVKQVQDGGLTPKQALDEISKNKKTELINALASMPVPGDTEADKLAKEKMLSAIALKDHKGLNSSVGPVPGTRLALGDIFGAKQDFTAKIDQLISDLSLESLIEAKSRGATFGALSDTEMKILSSAATTMASWRKENIIGSGTDHYAIDEKRFKDELDKIANIFQRAIKTTIEAPIEVDQNVQTMEDGTQWIQNEDGSMTMISDEQSSSDNIYQF